MFTHLTRVIFVLAVISLASATLSVYNLQALGESDLELLDIPYSIANFGFAPYLQLHLDLARPSSLDSCIPPTSPLNAWSTPTSTATTVIPNSYREQLPVDPTRRVPVRNEGPQCSKVGSADGDHNGRSLALEIGGDDRQWLWYSCDDLGYKVKIPSIFINYKKGKLLQDLL